VQSGRRSTTGPSSDSTEASSPTASTEPNGTDDSPDEAYEPYDYDEYAIDEALSADADETPDPEPAVSTEATDGTASADDDPLPNAEDEEDQ
jgi:hypothetical protein